MNVRASFARFAGVLRFLALILLVVAGAAAGGCGHNDVGLPLDYGGSGGSGDGAVATPDAVLLAGAVPKAASPGAVDCGSLTCSGGLPVCCFSLSTSETSCRAHPDSCHGDVTVTCDSAEDCTSGQICCADTSSLRAGCAPPQNCQGQSNLVLCKDTSDCDFHRRFCCPVLNSGQVLFACSAISC